MRMMLILSLIGLLCVSVAGAQNPYSQQPTTQSPASSSTTTPSSSIQGCLSGSNGEYVLTQDNTGTIFKLNGDNNKLKDHVGHEVQVTGQLMGSSSPSGDQAQASAQAANSAPANTIQVSDVTMVSEQCGAGSGATTPPSASATPGSSSDTSGAATVSGTDNGSSSAASSPAANDLNAGAGQGTAASTSREASAGSGSQSGSSATVAANSASAAPAQAPDTTSNTPSSSNTMTQDSSGQSQPGQTGANPAQPESGTTAAKNNGENLPQTATSLPSLALLGMVLLVAGLVSATRRKTNRETGILGPID